MLRGLRISVVIPCYNEEDGVREVIARMPPVADEVIVVDNNSTDGTAEVARSLGARVIAEQKRGYGAAYKAGFATASGDIIVALDGDGTYPPEAIPRLVSRLVDGEFDFLSASRFPLTDRRAMPLSNRLGNGILTLAMAALFRRFVRDSQSGMWVFRRQMLPKLALTSDGMPFSEEIKLEVIRHGLRFVEDHIDYGARLGDVKLDKWRDGWDNLVFLLRKRAQG